MKSFALDETHKITITETENGFSVDFYENNTFLFNDGIYATLDDVKTEYNI